MESLNVDISKCMRLVDLEVRKALLEKEVKEVVQKIEKLWSPILAEMTKAGLRSIPLKSGERLQPKRGLFCSKRSGVPTGYAVEALKKAGLNYIVEEGYAPGRLKEWLTEKDDQRKEAGDVPDDVSELLPAELRSIFLVTEKNSVVVYGAKAKAMAMETDIGKI